MITCFIKYDLDPNRLDLFERYARDWGEAIPRCGADLVGYFAPHEGSATTAYGVYHVESLAAYEAYRARLPSGSPGCDIPKSKHGGQRSSRPSARQWAT